MPPLNDKQNKNIKPIISRENYHLTQPCPSAGVGREELSTNFTLYEIYTNHWTGPTLGGQKPKGRKNSTLKPGKRRMQRQLVKRNNNEKAEKYYTNEGTN